MFWIILIVLIVVIILGKFLFALDKDKSDLSGVALSEKFNVIVNLLNLDAYGGNGSITTLSTRSFNLYEEGSNQIIQFHYSTGSLTITWRYKYFQKEVVHERQFDNVRNLSLFEQQNIAEGFIYEMSSIIERHKNDVFRF